MPTENYSPNWHVRCVSVPGPDTDLTLHVAFDNARYMFGCGEGTQRAYVQKKLGLKGVEAVFLLDAQNRTRMGLPGVMMTAADGGTQQLSVVGPPDTSHFISTFRSSVMRSDFSVIPRPLPIGKTPNDLTEVFNSPNVTVKAVALVPPSLLTATIETDSAPIDMTKFRPDFSSTRPSAFTRPELEAWRNLVVSHMFDRDTNKVERSRQDRSLPFIRPDGMFAASWPEIRYPLPLPTPEEQATEMVYILEPPPLRGKFNAKRAQELGVPSGPMRGRLVKGENIEVDDPSVEGGKRIVKPEDCLSGGGPAAVLIVVSCSPANLSSLLESTAFAPYQTPMHGTDEGRKVHVMVHRVTSAVWQDAAYQKWMTLFGEETQHFIADSQNYANDIYFRSSAWQMTWLNVLDSDLFTRPFDRASTPFETQPLPPNSTLLMPNHQIRMQPRGKLEVIPTHEKDEPLPPARHLSKAVSKERISLETKAAVARAQQAIHNDPRYKQKATTKPGDEIRVTTLGTGSAIPSKYRNVSSTVLTIPELSQGEFGEILLDCGEGTLGQMRRNFAPEGMYRFYKDLKMIYISHMHADHHLGLHSILEDRFRHGITTPLYILAPQSIGLHMQESASWQEPASDEALSNIFFMKSTGITAEPAHRREASERALSLHSPHSPTRALEDNVLYTEGTEDRFNESRRWPMGDCLGNTAAMNRYWAIVDQMLIDLDLKWLQVVEVLHRGTAYGLVMQHKSGWKIVYSGDTKPCANLVKVGMNATLLIHEATLEDDKAEMAYFKGHSTFSQAIQVGRDMKAKHILLNHFSQRYPKIPKIPTPSPSSPSSSSGSQNGRAEPIVSISFDLMSIKISEMWKMGYYMEPISLLFPDEEEGDDDVVKAVATDKNTDVTDVAVATAKTAKLIGKPVEGNGRGGKKRKDARVANIVRDASPESWSSPEMKPTGGKAKKQKKLRGQDTATEEMEMTNGGGSNGLISQNVDGKKSAGPPHLDEPASLDLDKEAPDQVPALELGIEADNVVSRNAFDQALGKHLDQAETAKTAEAEEGTGLTPALEDVSMTDEGTDGSAAK